MLSQTEPCGLEYYRHSSWQTRMTQLAVWLCIQRSANGVGEFSESQIYITAGHGFSSAVGISQVFPVLCPSDLSEKVNNNGIPRSLLLPRAWVNYLASVKRFLYSSSCWVRWRKCSSLQPTASHATEVSEYKLRQLKQSFTVLTKGLWLCMF